MSILGVLGMVLYFLMGLALAIPYMILSGSAIEDAGMLVGVAPVALLGLIILWHATRRKRTAFWVVASYFGLPIILNASSFYLELVGQPRVGHFIFTMRYASLPAVLGAAVIGATIVEAARTGLHHLRTASGHDAPPPSAPHDPSGDNTTATRSKGDDSPGLLRLAQPAHS